MSAVAPVPVPIRRTAAASALGKESGSDTAKSRSDTGKASRSDTGKASSGPSRQIGGPSSAARVIHPSRTTATISTPPPPSPSPPPAPPSSSSRRTVRPDPLSDNTTIALIRRVLCVREQKSDAPERPIDEILPPLTSRNDVDLQLYALVAILVREYVLSWYAQITPDVTFIEALVQLVAHCTRALEERIRRVDFESLLLDEVPDLVDRHVAARRASRRPLLGGVDPREVYHALCPVPQLSPVPSLVSADDDDKTKEAKARAAKEQTENEDIYRQLVAEGILTLLLPTEDLENSILTSFVVQIIAEVIVGSVLARKIAEPWMVYEIICLVAKPGRRRSRRGESALTTWSVKGAVFWVVHWVIVAFSAVRMLLLAVAVAWSLPSRYATKREVDDATDKTTDGEVSDSKTATTTTGSKTATTITSKTTDGKSKTKIRDTIDDQPKTKTWDTTPKNAKPDDTPLPKPDKGKKPDTSYPTYLTSRPPSPSQPPPPPPPPPSQETPKVPVLEYMLWECIGNLVELDEYMPWLKGALAMVQFLAVWGPGRVGGVDGILDRLLSHLIHKHILDPAAVPEILRSARAALFPNNAPSTAPGLVPPASDEELGALRRRCAVAIAAALPGGVKSVYFGSGIWGSRKEGEGQDKNGSSSENKSKGQNRDSGSDQSLDKSKGQDNGPGNDDSQEKSKAQSNSLSNDQNNDSSSEQSNGPNKNQSPSPTPKDQSPSQSQILKDQSNDQNTSQTPNGQSPSPTLKDQSNGQSPSQSQTLNDQNPPQKDSKDSKDTHTRHRRRRRRSTLPAPSDDETVLAQIDAMLLDVFADAYCNKHLVYALLELVLVRIFPELGERGVAELWEERLGRRGGSDECGRNEGGKEGK